MTDMVQLVALAVVSALCALVVKKQLPELGLVIGLAAGGLILSQVLGGLSDVRQLLEELSQQAGLSSAILSPVIKTVGIGLMTRIGAELCRDAKESGLAAFVETAGAVAALVVSLPLLQSVLQMILSLV